MARISSCWLLLGFGAVVKFGLQVGQTPLEVFVAFFQGLDGLLKVILRRRRLCQRCRRSDGKNQHAYGQDCQS